MQLYLTKPRQTGGMLATWNKMCFTGGLMEAAISLPGSPTVPGFWPAFWAMGNLGRAGYAGSTEGTVSDLSLKPTDYCASLT